MMMNVSGVVVEVQDEAAANFHSFEVFRDSYGVVVKHRGTGHNVVLEVHDGRLRALVYEDGDDEPVVNHCF